MSSVSYRVRAWRAALLTGGAALAVTWAPAAAAQAAPPTPDSQPSVAPAPAQTPDGVGDIVVTAQRRTERLEDVPISVTSISPQNAEQRGIRDLQDLSQAVAGVQINFQGAYTYPAIRGVSSLTTGIGFESNVALYIDGFYQPDPVALNVDFANLADIQILKGPQGALYGRNATGGAFLLTTLAPTDTFKGDVEAKYGNFNDRSIGGYLSGPLGHGIKFSVAAYHRDSDGYYAFLDASGNRIGDAAPISADSVRAKLEADLTSRFKATLGYNYTYYSDPRGSMFTNQAYRPASLPPQIGDLYDTRTFAANRPTETSARVHDATLTLAWNTGIGTLTSYTGYSWRTLRSQIDFDGSYLDLSANDAHFTYRTFQENVDYAINAIDRLDLVVGGNYYNDIDRTCPNYAYSGNQLRSRTCAAYGTVAWALFTDATYHLTDRLSIGAGARYTDESKETQFAVLLYPSLTYSAPPADQTRSFNNFSPRGVVKYEIAPRTNVYASVTRGFRSGLTQILATQGVSLVTAVKPETITAYEIGFKTARHAFRFDVAGFYYDYRNLQVGVTIPNPACTNCGPVNLISNAPKAEIYGIDGQATYTPMRDFDINVTGSWLHARYLDFTNATGTGLNAATGLNATSQIQDWSNQQVARAPTFSASLALDYTLHDVAGGSLRPSTNIKYTASYVPNNPSLYGPLASPGLAGQERYRQPSYTLVNAALDWFDRTGRFSVGVFVNNLTNHDYRLSYTGSTFGDYETWAPPRTFGGRVGYRF